MSAARLDAIRSRAADQGGGSMLVTHRAHVRWACGFTGSNGFLLVAPSHALLVTDGRYTAQASAETDSVEVRIAERSLWAALGPGDVPSGPLLIPSEHLTVASLKALQDRIEGVETEPVAGLLEPLVAAKDDDEVARVSAAQSLSCEVFDAVLPYVAPDVSELDLAAEIVYQHLKRGASAMSFDPIVASGPRAALPHARPSERTLQPGDLVVMDMGGVLDGYCSDLTRTVALGEPGEDARTAYTAVLNAQEAALKTARAGVDGGDLDRAARKVLEAAGLVDYYTHSLGHGVGLDIHEWPRLSHQSEVELPEGATVTVEPGVYVPGRFGIRIEDVIVLREGGHDNLTPLPKSLLVL